MGELEIFSIRIKELRISLNMTQKEFSEHVGIKQQTLSGYERGIMKPPLDIAKEIAEKCNVSLDWLCGLTEKRNYNNRIETYSDIVNFLSKLEQTELQMELFSVTTRKSDPPVHAITFNNKKMYTFLEEFRQILELKHNSTIEEHLYNLWIKDALEKYNTKIELDQYLKYY